MNCEKIILKFIQNYNFTEKNSNILGILFYGSRLYNTNKPNSDIDLLIVTNSFNNYKGVVYVDGVKIEYFEKNIGYLLEKIKELDYSNDASLISIFKNGKVIFSKDNIMEYLIDEILSKNYITIKNRNSSHKLLNEWYMYFRNLSIEDNFFRYVYYNLLEIIRKAYHDNNGYSKIPCMKVFELYSNKKYAKDYYCVNMPPSDFRNFYLSIIVDDYNKEKLEQLLSMVSIEDKYYEKNQIIYKKQELEYQSTIVENSISKIPTLLQERHPAFLYYYYITLEKIRVLYCNIKGINFNIYEFGNDYEDEFMNLFNLSINDYNNLDNLKKLFYFVSTPLDINYTKYRVLEYHT